MEVTQHGLVRYISPAEMDLYSRDATVRGSNDIVGRMSGEGVHESGRALNINSIVKKAITTRCAVTTAAIPRTSGTS